jgi:hypothetical protein
VAARSVADPGPFRTEVSNHLGLGPFMRYLMSAHAETTRIGPRPHARRRDLPAQRAVRCPLVPAREVAPRTNGRPLGARLWGTSDQIGAASAARAGLRRAGVVQWDWLRHPDLPVARSEKGRATGKPILHAVRGGLTRCRSVPCRTLREMAP